MDKQQILELAKSDPRFSQAVQKLEQQIGDMPVTPDGLNELVQMLEVAINNPDKYVEIMEAAVKDGYIDQGDFPPQFDQVFLVSILAVLYGLQERVAPQQGFAKGGLAQAAEQLRMQGRGGDTMLAHINPREAEMLRRSGGSGSINPQTGLPEYGFLKKLFKAAAPIAAVFVAPYLAPFLGGSMLAAGALAGGLGSALTGGNILQGAALGGLSGGLGGMAGGAANNAMGLGLGQAGQAVLGGGLVGGAVGAATGQGFMKGAAQGALGQYVGGAIGSTGAGGDFGRGLTAGGSQFGNMLTAGYDPKTAAAGGVLSGLATGITRPSQAVVDNYTNPAPELGTGNYDMATQPGLEMVSQGGVNPTQTVGQGTELSYTPPTPQTSMGSPELSGSGFGLDAGTALKGLALASMLSGAPQPVQQAVGSLSPSQQEYFNRPSVKWDWNKMQGDASSSGLSLGQYMAQNWNQVSSGAYNQPTEPRQMSRGGALSQVAYAVGGLGSGRDDKIDAKLSDGEYVMDAETVAMLGDGSGKSGAARLDQMRSALRAHKGKNLSRGQISPNAKSPLAYLKGAR